MGRAEGTVLLVCFDKPYFSKQTAKTVDMYVSRGVVYAQKPLDVYHPWLCLKTLFAVLWFFLSSPFQRTSNKTSTTGGAVDRKPGVPKPKDHWKPLHGRGNVVGVDRLKPPPNMCLPGGGGG